MGYKNKITNNHPGYAISSRNTEYADSFGGNVFQNTLGTSLPNRDPAGIDNQATTSDGETYFPLVIPLQFYILAGGIASSGTQRRYFVLLDNNDSIYPDKFPAYTSYFIKGLICSTDVWNFIEGDGTIGVKGTGNTTFLMNNGYYNNVSVQTTTPYDNTDTIANYNSYNSFIAYNADCSKLYTSIRFNNQPSDGQKDIFVNLKITLI